MLLIPIVISVSILVFLVIKMIPGDPVAIMFGKNANQEQIAYVRGLYGLDRPLAEQYFTWIGNILRGDWGSSIQTGEPVFGLIMERMPKTIVWVFALKRRNRKYRPMIIPAPIKRDRM